MKYKIEQNNENSRIISNRGESIFDDSEGNFGKLTINFFYDGNAGLYENSHVNISLFLSEISIFFSGLNNIRPLEWKLGFSTFAHGLLSDNNLLISTLGGDQFSKGIYDFTSAHDLKYLKKNIEEDILLYGKFILRNDLSKDGLMNNL